MEVIPAVDIMKGRVVRLVRGNPLSVKSYESLGDPISIAKKWKTEGAQTVHIVDLDAALSLGNSATVVEEIVSSVKVLTQVGGGIRSLETPRAFLDMGVDRVILGSLVFTDQSIVKALLNEYGENRIMVALDHLNGSVMVKGWTSSTKMAVDKAVSIFSKIGVRFFLATSVERDGTMMGPDLDTLRKLSCPNTSVMAAGGIRNIEDLLTLKRLGLFGAVIGKALYEGQISLKEALKTAKE